MAALRLNRRTSSSSSTNSQHQQSRLPRDSLLHSDVLHFTENRNRKEETAWVDRALVQAASLRCLTTETHVRSHANPCEISGGQSGSWTGFSPSSSDFSFQYYSTNAPRSSLPTYSSYHKEKQAKSGNLPKSSALISNRTALYKKALSLVCNSSTAPRTAQFPSPYLVNFPTRYLASTPASAEGRTGAVNLQQTPKNFVSLATSPPRNERSVCHYISLYPLPSPLLASLLSRYLKRKQKMTLQIFRPVVAKMLPAETYF